MFAWTRLTKVTLVVGCLLFAAVLSCDEVRRHKTLTFFFDGVPPLEGYVSAAGEGAAGTGVWPTSSEPTINIHEPRRGRQCHLCHGKKEKRVGFSSEVKLVAQPPQLCFRCHPNYDYSTSSQRVHGPVAMGDCLQCHHHHESMNVHLLKKPVPEICFNCHDKEDIVLIPNHSEESASACLRCHAGHSSSKKGLLKANPEQKPNLE